jgi:3-methyladenine DNA glycosylase AlkD
MTLYERLLADLNANVDVGYKNFNFKLLGNDKLQVLGVRVPILRKLAKQYKDELPSLLHLPDDYYEVTFVKLCAVSLLPYESFIALLDECVRRIDNWAVCDSFKAKCIKANRQDFIKYIKKYIAHEGEFCQRYALTTLLSYYVDEEYLPLIFECAERANTNYYYTHMAVAWLVAEVLTKYFSQGVDFLNRHSLDKSTHNKAIQKATESFRLSEQNKNYLKTIKR